MPRTLDVTERTRLHRKPGRGAYDRAVIDQILDEALICHVGFPGPTAPVVLPTALVRLEDTIYIHGSAASGMLRSLAGGPTACVVVTLLDALVLARTAFHHSVNYRSVVLFDRARLVDDKPEKRRALDALVNKMVANRAAACRAPTDHELAATKVLAFSITEASAKVRSGPPVPDDGEDAALPYWAGVIPLVTTRGAPITAPDCTVAIEPGWERTPT